MPSGIFNNLKNISWECFHCGVPNFSSSFFNSTLESSISNRFDILSPENISGQSFSFGSPAATSSQTQERKSKASNIPKSPDQIKVLVINCRKMEGKKPLLEALLDLEYLIMILFLLNSLQDLKQNPQPPVKSTCTIKLISIELEMKYPPPT